MDKKATEIINAAIEKLDEKSAAEFKSKLENVQQEAEKDYQARVMKLLGELLETQEGEPEKDTTNLDSIIKKLGASIAAKEEAARNPEPTNDDVRAALKNMLSEMF